MGHLDFRLPEKFLKEVKFFYFTEDKAKPSDEKPSGTTPSGSSSSSSLKRSREDREGKKSSWVDPSKAPDPEEPEEFDKDSLQTLMDTGFEAPG